MELEAEILERLRRYESLSRWEKAEFGRERAARTWWARQLFTECGRFHQVVRQAGWHKSSQESSPHGVCTLVRQRSADAFVMTMAWIEFLQQEFRR